MLAKQNPLVHQKRPLRRRHLRRADIQKERRTAILPSPYLHQKGMVLIMPLADISNCDVSHCATFFRKSISRTVSGGLLVMHHRTLFQGLGSISVRCWIVLSLRIRMMYPLPTPKWRVRWTISAGGRLCATQISPKKHSMLSAPQMRTSKLLGMGLLEPLTSFQRICG